MFLGQVSNDSSAVASARKQNKISQKHFQWMKVSKTFFHPVNSMKHSDRRKKKSSKKIYEATSWWLWSKRKISLREKAQKISKMVIMSQEVGIRSQLIDERILVRLAFLTFHPKSHWIVRLSLRRIKLLPRLLLMKTLIGQKKLRNTLRMKLEVRKLL